MTDAGLAHPSGCPDLHTLNLGGVKIDGSGLTHLRGATKLTWLSLGCTNVTDASQTASESVSSRGGSSVTDQSPGPMARPKAS
ncbi:hypothetical protein [Gemmata sp.]|uniref:hypothetical protein n=1 Tax=Gemmata sp. TaxID=1914242 RepID=UPI003F6FB9BD